MENTKKEKTFFGQPRGLSVLFQTELWERFSYYGMRAILLFYMYYAIDQGGLGMNQTLAASVMSIYGSSVMLASILGGWFADRVFGPRKTVFYGGVLIMIGHIVLSFPMGIGALYTSIVFIVIGTGLLKPNVSDMVGDLYSPDDRRRDAGFSIYVFGVNLGSALAPILVPWAKDGFGVHAFGNTPNFHAGFSLAAIGMFIGLIVYYFGGKKSLSEKSLHPIDPIPADKLRSTIWKAILVIVLVGILLGIMAVFNALNIENIINLITILAVAFPIYYFVLMLRSPKVTKTEHKKVLAYIPLFIAGAIFWGIEESGSTVLALFAQNRTVLHIGAWHFEAANFQTLNPLFIMILTPFFVWLWDNWKNQPSAAGKFATGLVFAGLSYLFMTLPGILHPTGRVSPFWLVGSWFIVEIAEMLISPIGLAATSRLAPKAFSSQMMSLWFLCDAVGQAAFAQVVKFYSTKTEVPFFTIIGLISIVFGIILFFMVKNIDKLMGDAK